MKFEITDSPNSYLIIDLKKDEKIITEKSCLIYSDGEYNFENKIEGKGYKNILALIGGKSITYNIYTAKEDLKINFSPKDSSEIFNLEIQNNNPIFINPSNLFSRTCDIRILPPSGFDKDLFLKTDGFGTLFLKYYGKIIEKEIDSSKPFFINVDSVIAYEEKLKVEAITGLMKAIIGNSEIYKVSGNGKIWIQSKDRIELKKD